MKVALFLTTERGPAVALAKRVHEQHPNADLSIFVRDEDRSLMADTFPDAEIRRDKPAGSKKAFVAALRRERFDHLVVAWYGGERPQPLRLVAMFAGARRVLAVDETGREFRVAWYLPWTWGIHTARRLAKMDTWALLRACGAFYRATLGLVVASVRLLVFRLSGPRLPGR